MNDLAARAMVLDPALTQIIDQLIDAAMVYRRADPVHRHRVLVFLSHHGRERYRQLDRTRTDGTDG